MKTTIINFYLEYDEDSKFEPVYIQWNEIKRFIWIGNEDNGSCEENSEYVDNDPMRKFYVEKYKRMPEYDKEYGRAFWMDGYRLPKSKGWSYLGLSDTDHYSFIFANRKDAENARKLLETAE